MVDWDRAVIPPLLHGYADVTVTVALILLPFILGFDNSTAIQSSAGAAIARALLLPLWRSSSLIASVAKSWVRGLTIAEEDEHRAPIASGYR